MDEVARTAKVSKATVYSYFPDKQSLFIEVVKAECEHMADHAMEEIDQSKDIRQVLNKAAGYMVNFFLSEFSQRMFRICVAEADRIPELGRQFYENGPMMGRQHIAEYLRKAAEAGKSKSMISNLPRINSPNCAKQRYGHRRFLEFAVNLTTMKNSGCFSGCRNLLSGLCPQNKRANI